MRTIISTNIFGNEFYVKKYEVVENGRYQVFLGPKPDEAYNFGSVEEAADAVSRFVNPFDRDFKIKSKKIK